MNRKVVSGIMLTQLLILLMLAFNIKLIRAIPEITLSDKEIIPNPPNTSSVAFMASTVSPTTTRIWFQIKATPDETGTRLSQCAGSGEYLEIQDSRRLTIIFVDESDPRSQTIEGDIIYMVDPYWFYDWPTTWACGITTVYDSWEHALTGCLAELVFQPVVTATIDIDPDTLNLKSKGKWITAYIQLPEEYNPEDIDAATILLNETIQPDLDPKYGFVANSSEYIVDHNEDGILERMVKFDKAELMASLSVGEATLSVTGEVNGTPFQGTDTIRVRD